jgi:hypothetical protein
MKCFKCLSTDALPFHKSAPYLAAKLYLCPSCIRLAKKHEPDRTFDCGCTEKREAGALEKHWLPPNPLCPACSGTGKISDNHAYLKIKKSVGATDPAGRGRHGHSYQSTTEEEVDPILLTYPDGGWMIDAPIQSTGKRPGRPKTTIHDLEVLKYYLARVVNEVAEEYQWTLGLEGHNFFYAVNTLTNIILARGYSANPRALAQWLHWSNRTIDRRRRKGERMDNLTRDMQRFLVLKQKAETRILSDQLNRIESTLQDMKGDDDERWIELFRRVYGLSEEDMEVDESEFDLEDTP